jgi:hypothetical protein
MLLVFHRILVSTAIAFCGVMVWFEAMRWRDEGSNGAIVIAALCVVVAAALVWYLKNLRRFVKLDR